jgi:hydroxyethylthiazole kinase-like sugar kinase family protein
LGKLWLKGVNVTKEEAMTLLDHVKNGYPATIAKINEALLKTGDLDLFVDRKQQNRIYSGQELKVDEQAVGCLSHAVKYWAADRKA